MGVVKKIKTIVWSTYSDDGTTVEFNVIYNTTGRNLTHDGDEFLLDGTFTPNYTVHMTHTYGVGVDISLALWGKIRDDNGTVGVYIEDNYIQEWTERAPHKALIFKIEIYE